MESEYGIASGLIRNDPTKENPPENPYEDEYLPGTDSKQEALANKFAQELAGADLKKTMDDLTTLYGYIYKVIQFKI